MGAIKPTTILFVLLMGLSLSARAGDSDCAQLLAPSFQSRELSTVQKFRAYVVDLLEGGELGFDVFANFSKNLNEGILANPVTEDVALLNWELDFHRSLLQEYVDSGELDIEQLSVWALERLEKMERDRSGQEAVSEEIKKIPNIDVTSRTFWEQVTDRYIKYIPVGEKISGSDGMEAIHFAVQYAPLNTLKQFVDIHQKDLNVNAKDNHGAPPLTYAARSGNPETVSALVNAGADVNVQNNIGNAPLMWAAWSGNPETVSALVNAGADVNVQNYDGKPPLIWAASFGNHENVNILVNAGADVNVQNDDGKTPLMYAARSGNPETVSTLVNAGADVNVKDNIGMTPLMHAAWRGNPETVSALVNAGADVNAKDNDRTTPLMFTAHHGNPDAVNILKKAGAKEVTWFSQWFDKLFN